MAAVPPCLSRCGQKSKVARGRVGSVGIAAGCAGDCGTVERDVNRDGLTDDAGCRLRCGCGFLFGLALGSLFLFEVTLGAEVLKYPVRPSLVPGELWHLGYSSALQPLSPRPWRSRPSTVHASDEHGSAVDGDGCSRGHWLLHRVHVSERDVVGFAYTPDWQLRCKARVHGGFLVLGHRSP